jgi:Ca2+-binding RTX toxin-like protein
MAKQASMRTAMLWDGRFSGSAWNVQFQGSQPTDVYALESHGAFVFTGSRQGGISVWEIAETGVLRLVEETSQDAHQTALTVVQSGAEVFLVSASATAHSLTVWQQTGSGGLTQTASLGMSDGPGIAGPSELASVTLNGVPHVIVAGSDSSSLSVFQLGQDGSLSATDHLIDGLDTRFQGVSALSVAEHDGNVFVAAGGADDGVSLFLLLDTGKVLHLGTLADTLDAPLQNVESIALNGTEDRLQLFVSSGSEDRVGHFEADLSSFGVVLTGTDGDDNLTGSAQDDVLVAGDGEDRLTGGAGSDIFALDTGAGQDTITDFDAEQDTIDLSLIPMLYTVDQVTIWNTATGAILDFGGQRVTLDSADGETLDADNIRIEFGPAHFAVTAVTDDTGGGDPGGGDPGGGGTGDPGGTGGRPMQGTNGADRLSGTEENDSISALAGDDLIFASEGGDSISGGDGYDVVSFADAQERVLVDLQIDVSTAGFARFFVLGAAAGDTYDSIEGLIGGWASDNLRGASGNDSLLGGGRSDRLYGRAGDDTLDGGIGADALYGNRGVDIMTGGPDEGRRDRFIYFNEDETGVGAGNRDIITDFVSGEDRIEISRIDADTTIGRKQTFDFIGATAFSGTAGELRYQASFWDNRTIVQADTDGDGFADFEIELVGYMSLLRDDFLL